MEKKCAVNKIFSSTALIKKGKKIFLINKEIQSGAVANSYMRRLLVIYDFATAPFWTSIQYEENFVFFLSVWTDETCQGEKPSQMYSVCPHLPPVPLSQQRLQRLYLDYKGIACFSCLDFFSQHTRFPLCSDATSAAVKNPWSLLDKERTTLLLGRFQTQ
jgi:hypothetical protein